MRRARCVAGNNGTGNLHKWMAPRYPRRCERPQSAHGWTPWLYPATRWPDRGLGVHRGVEHQWNANWKTRCGVTTAISIMAKGGRREAASLRWLLRSADWYLSRSAAARCGRRLRNLDLSLEIIYNQMNGQHSIAALPRRCGLGENRYRMRAGGLACCACSGKPCPNRLIEVKDDLNKAPGGKLPGDFFLNGHRAPSKC